MEAARDALPPRIRAGLEQMIVNIRRFAETQLPETRTTTIVPGVEIERRWVAAGPSRRLRPGRLRRLPSSLLMGVVPAQVAGVGTVVVASPADADGGLNQTLLGAAGLAGVDVFIVAGGAQAVGRDGVRAAGRGRRAGRSDRRVRATPGSPRPSSRSSASAASTCRPGRPKSWSWPTPPRTRSTSPPTCSRRPSTAPTPLPCWSPGTPPSRPRVEVELAVSWRRRRAARSWSGPSARARWSSWRPDRDAALDFVNAYAPEHLSVVVDDVEEAVARLRNAGSLFVGPYAPGIRRRLRLRRQPRPADRRPGPLLRRALDRELRQVHPGPAHHPRRPGGHPRRGRSHLRGRRPDRPQARRRSPVRGAGLRERRDEPAVEPEGADVAALPTYVWEPTTDFLAAKYGLPRESIVRFDVNTSPLPPDLRDVLAGRSIRVLSRVPAQRLRRSGGRGRGRVRRRAGRNPAHRRRRRGAGPDRSGVPARRFAWPWRAVPTYAMYRIVTEQRGAALRGRAARSPPETASRLDIPAAGRRRARRGPGLAVRAEQPDRHRRAAGAHRRAAAIARRRTPPRDGRPAPAVVVDEAYAEFAGRSVLPLRDRYPRLVVVRTLSKAHALAGARVGFAVARPETLAPIVSFRAPASVSTVSAALATAALRRPELAAANVARIARAARPPHRGAGGARLAPVSVAGQLHPVPLRVRRGRGRQPPRPCCARASCRAPSARTIRSPIACG